LNLVNIEKMAMTPEQKKLVSESWAKVLPIQETAAELFYARLFEVYPEVKPYFKGDMKEQGKKLMAMLTTAVNGLDHLDTLIQPLTNMGARHVEYGVKNEDYDKVADALLWTLEHGLGEDFTLEVRQAWIITYTKVADVMKAGAACVAES